MNNGYLAAVFAGVLALLSAVFAGVQAFRKQAHEQRVTDTNTAIGVLQASILDYKTVMDVERKERKEEAERQDKEISGLSVGLRKCHDDHASSQIKNAGLEAQVRLLEQTMRAMPQATVVAVPAKDDKESRPDEGENVAGAELEVVARKKTD